MEACMSFVRLRRWHITNLFFFYSNPRRKSHCGGKGTWWERVCPIRPSLPHRGSRARLLQRALWSRQRRRRVDRAALSSSRHLQDLSVSEIPVDRATSGEAAVFTRSHCWDEEGRPTCSNAVCEQWNSLHEAFKVASGCWSCCFSLMCLLFLPLYVLFFGDELIGNWFLTPNCLNL